MYNNDVLFWHIKYTGHSLHADFATIIVCKSCSAEESSSVPEVITLCLCLVFSVCNIHNNI